MYCGEAEEGGYKEQGQEIASGECSMGWVLNCLPMYHGEVEEVGARPGDHFWWVQSGVRVGVGHG